MRTVSLLHTTQIALSQELSSDLTEEQDNLIVSLNSNDPSITNEERLVMVTLVHEALTDYITMLDAGPCSSMATLVLGIEFLMISRMYTLNTK